MEDAAGPTGTIRHAGRSHVGHVRDTNQDRFLARAPVFAVADGVGGRPGGEVAAALVVETLEARMRAGRLAGSDELRAALLAADEEIRRRGAADPVLGGMSTTCTAAILQPGTAAIAHVGDSRAYRLRGGELRRLTTDHTLVERLLREGRIGRAEVAEHPRRNVIERALGAAPDRSPDIDVAQVDLEPGDRLLLCSDGLSGLVDDERIAAALTDGAPAEAADRLVELALAAGGRDNVTVLVVDPPTAAAMPAPVARGRRSARAVALLAAVAIVAAGAWWLLLGAAVVLAPVPPSAAPSMTPSPATPSVTPVPSPSPSSPAGPGPSSFAPSPSP